MHSTIANPPLGAQNVIAPPQLMIFVDQEVIKTFSQDQSRIDDNKSYGNMNKNSKNRKAGQFSQGNKMYLSIYQKSTRKCRKLALDYVKAEYGIDSDEDKLSMIFESQPFIR